MEPEHRIAVSGVAFFGVIGVLLAVSVWRGRRVCRLFAERWPELYAEREFPLPGFFLSPRRNAYFRFVLQRQFEELPDPHLVAEFERLRRAEMRDLVILVAGFGALGIAFLWLRFIRPD